MIARKRCCCKKNVLINDSQIS
ncbi:hypothetical protein DW650_15705 [Roseburia sp. AM23-20]|nr:hypothetical protein DW650_15705 [Roseburia sp. AM23-20]